MPSQTDLEPVTLSWTPEVADIRQAGKVLRATRPKRYLWDIICGVLGAFVLICFQSDAGQWVPWALLTLLMTIMSARITATAMRYSLWRQSPANGVPIEGTIDPQTGITLRSATTVIVPWDSIKRLHETERVFVAEIKGYAYLAVVLVAKRGLPEGWDVDELRFLLHESLKHARTP